MNSVNYEDSESKKKEPQPLIHDPTFEENSMMSPFSKREELEEDMGSKKREPGLLQYGQMSEKNSMNGAFSKREEEEMGSKKREPGLLQYGQMSEKNSMNSAFSKREKEEMGSKKRELQPQQTQTDIHVDEESRLKLEDAMKTLRQTHVLDYIASSHEIMEQLHKESKNRDDSFLRWVRFLDISAHKYEDFHFEKGDRETFIHQLEELVLQILFLDHSDPKTPSSIDWRIAKKIISLNHLFPRLSPSLREDGIFTAVRNEIVKALDQMAWAAPSKLTDLAKGTLQTLSKRFDDKLYFESLKQAVILGRFDKAKFGLSNSLIFGEDGGLYLLLNRLTEEQQKDMIDLNIVNEEYLKDKILKNPEDKDKNGDKVVLGKGGFGTVKFALSLFRSKSDCGGVICIKKTRSFAALAARKHHNTLTPLQVATGAIMDDYFASDIADKVYAPQIFDLAIVSNSLPNEKNDLSTKGSHQKGYLMMEVFPQNTATKVFKEAKYQKWKYQKPYLYDTMLATLELLNQKIAFTDLKPDNTLYDPDMFQTTIIDLGGIIKIEASDSVDKFDKRYYAYTITKNYFAPEFQNTNIFDLSKALAYTCGKVMEEVAQKSDYKNIQELQTLVGRLTHKDPDQRMSIEEALDCLKKMGDDTDKEEILLKQYIHKIKERINDNRTSISLNEDILTTKELYIDLKITSRDPEKYKEQETEDLFKRIDGFLAADQLKHQVMAILGSAGSGKSIALQIKFIEAVQKWKKGQPLPIYFNLANGIDLKSIINSMNSELGTNVKLQELQAVHLYIDSFDEGLKIEEKRESLIKDYMTELKNTSVKVLITCRSNYLENENCARWFTPQVNAFDRLTTWYVAPMSYIAGSGTGKKDWNPEEQKENVAKNELSWRKKATQYLERQSEKQGIQVNNMTTEETLKKLAILNLDTLIDTGLMFHIVMEVLPDLLEDKNQSRSRSKQDIYLKYITKIQKEQLHKLNKNKEQETQVLKYTKFIQSGQEKAEFTLMKAIRDLGKYLAVQLHLQDKFRLEQDAPIFQAMGYENMTHFKKQALWHILKILPLKIETKHSNNSNKIKSQEVKVGFIHDTIKNCYLLDAIQEEMSTQNGKSQTLSSKSIVADNELVRFIADAACHDKELKTYLRRAIDLTKSDKTEGAAIFAANCITILVSARYSFWGQDLSNINVRGSNLENGIFSGTNFTEADLTYTNLKDVQASEATFRKANLIGAKLGILPDLRGHTDWVKIKSVSFSGDGRYVASGSRDGTVKIWEVQTNECVSTLQGHTESVTGVSFSGDGRYVASGSEDTTVKIWEVQTNECVSTLQGHTDDVSSVSFSGNGRYVASGSFDSTVKIWEVQTNKCVSTLKGHTHRVSSVSFSGDGRYVASGSPDKTVKIWEVQTNKCVSTLKGHTHRVSSVSFSGDGRYVASGSPDKTVKIWEVQTNKCVSTLQGHTDYVIGVSFSGDGRYVASGSSDKTVKIWEVQTNECVSTLQGHTDTVWSVSFSGDGRYVASGSDDKTVKIWEVQTNKCVSTLQGHTQSVNSVSFSVDGRYVASGSADKTVKIWEIQTNKCHSTLQDHTDYVSSVSFSGDGRYVASGSYDKTVKIWEVQTNECVSTLQGHTGEVWSVSFSGDGRYVASGSSDKTVKIWEMQTNKCVSTLQGHTDYVIGVSFSGDGRYVASGSEDTTVKIWEVQTNKCVSTLQDHTGWVKSVSFSGDGRYVASGSPDKTVKIWEVQTNKCVSTLQGHTQSVNSVSFSVDGRYVASGSSDKTVKIWEMQTNKCVSTLQGHTQSVNSVSFSVDGRYIASGSEDKTVIIWSNNNGRWLPEKIYKGTMGPLNIKKAVLEEATISSQIQEIFKQREAVVKNNIIENNAETEVKHDLERALSIAKKISDQLLTHQISAYKDLALQKFVQIDL